MSKALWQHQREAYDFALMAFVDDGASTVTIVGRQGCGKTTTSIAIAASLVEDRKIRGAVFCAPLNTIIDGFASHPGVTIPPGARSGRTIEIATWWPKSGRKLDKEEFLTWFRKGHKEHPFLAMTHHALRKRALLLPEDLSGMLLVLDEVHHAPLAESFDQTVIGRVRDSWIERGGTVLQTSATPWHTDSEMLVYRRSDPFYQISSTDLARAKIGPTRFDVGRVVLPYTADALRDWLDPSNFDVRTLTKVYKALVDEWVGLERPVVLVRHPDNKHVEPLSRAFASAGARVFDATGNMSSQDTARIVSERSIKHYSERTIDVVLASRRFDEGTDLPTISAVFYLGSPLSVRHVLQVYGRSMRDKGSIRGMPAQHMSTATMRFFVPRASDEIMAEYMNLHHQDAIAIATYLSDYQIGHEVIESLRDELKASFVRNMPPSKRTTVNDALLQRFMLTEHDMAWAKAEVRQIAARVSSSSDVAMHEISVKHVAAEIAKMPQSRRRARLETAFVLEAGQSVPTIARRMKAIIESVLRDREEKDKTIAHAERDFRRNLHGFVSEVATAWESITTMSYNRKVLNVVSRFTGIDADKIAEQIRKKALPRPHRWEVAQSVRLYWHRRGTWPKRTGGDAGPYGLKGYTWRQINDHWPEYKLPGKDLEEYGREHVRGR